MAEPRRRQILEVLSTGEMSVGELAERLDWPQPLVSTHLTVLRIVGLVDFRFVMRKRIYWVNGDVLKPVYDWVRQFEDTWTE